MFREERKWAKLQIQTNKRLTDLLEFIDHNNPKKALFVLIVSSDIAEAITREKLDLGQKVSIYADDSLPAGCILATQGKRRLS